MVGVGVMVGTWVREGVGVMVGVSVMVGVALRVGVRVIVALGTVGEGVLVTDGFNPQAISPARAPIPTNSIQRNRISTSHFLHVDKHVDTLCQ